MNKKQNRVVEFVKAHKKGIIGTAIVGVVGVVAGIVGHKCYISKNYGELIKEVSSFGDHPDGTTVVQSTTEFFRNSYAVNPIAEMKNYTIADALGERLVSGLEEYGIDTSAKVSGILVGTVKE